MNKIFLWASLFAFFYANAQNTNDSLTHFRMEMAKSYIHAEGANKQPSKAMELFAQCADEGNAEAMNAMGVIYNNGLAGKKDSLKALQWFTMAANAGYANAWYNLGTIYRESMEFNTAFLCYSKAAEMGEAHGIFFKGYMLYKGLGCTQNYKQAAALFAHGAVQDKANSMYYYGLCFRNGYGVAVNKDSAKFWLARSVERGHNLALEELLEKLPENAEIAGILASKIKAAQAVLPNKGVPNKYRKVNHQATITEVGGIYKGYLLKYDWSGQHVVEANKLEVALEPHNDSLNGLWIEDDSIRQPIHALFTPESIMFKEFKYSKISHYSSKRLESTIFQSATLQLTNSDSGLYLSGNIQAFTPRSKEPQRPLFLALVKTGKVNRDIPFSAIPLRTYPNPFNSSINMDFEIKEACEVSTKLYTVEGKQVYYNSAGVLSPGSYTLPIQTQQIAAGYYKLVLRCGNIFYKANVMKY